MLKAEDFEGENGEVLHGIGLCETAFVRARLPVKIGSYTGDGKDQICFCEGRGLSDRSCMPLTDSCVERVAPGRLFPKGCSKRNNLGG